MPLQPKIPNPHSALRTPHSAFRIPHSQLPWVYYITDRKSCPVPLLQNIRMAIEASVDFIQIREKDLSARELLTLATRAHEMAQGHNTKILLNDRLDVALAVDLNGIHLGQNSVQPGQIRSRIPRRDFLIGVSTHSVEEVKQIEGQGVDYITFGPIFFTPSKAVYGKPLGLEALKNIGRSTRIPVLALGGVDRNNYKQCLANGASGIAAIRLFQNSEISLKEIVPEIKSCGISDLRFEISD